MLQNLDLLSNLENQSSHCEDPKGKINVQQYTVIIYFTPTGEPVFEM